MKRKDAYGFFLDPVSELPKKVPLRLLLEHLPGTPLPGVLGRIFFWVKIPQYMLCQDVLFFTSDNEKVLIRKEEGFIFNGGSVPFMLWWLYPPDQPDCLPGFLVHDKLCTPPYRYCSWRVHRYLWEAIRANGAKRLKASIVWLAVRLLGPRFKHETGATS